MDIEKAHIILKDLHKILNKYNIKYFLACGTCLGFVRDGEFMKWDRDIDIGIIPEKKPFERIIYREMIKLGYEFNKKTVPRKSHRDAIGMEIPLISFIQFSKYKIDVDFYICHFNNKHTRCALGRKCSAPVHCLDELKNIDIRGLSYNIPNPIEDYMIWNFGKGWKIPDKEFKSASECKYRAHPNIAYEGLEK